MNEPTRKVSVLDLRTLAEEEVSELNYARWGHSSIALGDNMFVMGGRVSATDGCSSIECFNFISRQVWSTLIESNEQVARYSAAVAAISSDKIVVFGGMNNEL